MTETRPQSLASSVYEALWKYSADLVAIVDQEGRIRYASPSYERVLGYSPEQLVATSLFQRVHPDDAAAVRAALVDILSSTEPMTVRLRTRRADGDWRVLEATGANHLDDPVVRGIVVNSRDITDRIEAVQRLQRQEARYRHIVESTLDSLVLSDLDGTILEANDVAHELYGYEHGDFVGRNLVELVDPEWGDSVGEIMSGLQSGTVATFTGICRRKDGERIWIEGRASLVQEDGKTFVLSMARSITERVRSFELLEQRVQERTRELATLLDVARTISSTLDLETLMSLVLDAMQRLVGYDGASLSVIDGDDLVIVAGRQGFDVARPASRRVALDERSDIWYLVARGGPVLIDDVLGDSPLALAYREAAAKFQWEANFRAWLGVPVMLKGEAVGVLSMVHREASLFTQHHVDLVDGVTQQLAVAIENVRLYARAQEAAILEERQRLSRELHDSVSQVLYSVALSSKTARALVERDTAGASRALDFTIAQAERGLAEMRALIFELRPESLRQEGVVSALQRQISALAARYDVPIKLIAGKEPDVQLQAKEALYRIAQECLHNTFKHAAPHAVTVTLSESAEAVVLEVRDDGKGMDPSGEFPGHLGLRSMRERALRLGGSFEIESEIGQGTTVRVTLPH